MSQYSKPTTSDWNSLQWTCNSCGTSAIQGDVCPNCGSFKDAPKDPNKRYATNYTVVPDSIVAPSYTANSSGQLQRFTEEPPVNSATFLPQKAPFLFNQRHAAFVEGRSRRLSVNWALHFMFLLFGGMALGFAIFGSFQYMGLRDLNARGIEVPATLIDHRYTISTGKSTTYTYFVKYQYTANDRILTSEQTVSRSIYNGYVKNAKVTVHYLPDAPTTVRLSGKFADDEGITNAFYLSLAGFMGVAIAAILVVNSMLRNQRLSSGGQIVVGQVLGSELTRSKSTYSLKLRYEFVSPQTGKLLTRKESLVRNDLRNSGKPSGGVPINILYLDDRTFRAL